jgi:uncharacterized protein YdhG (YjbR/CyaY superfamily)
MAVLKTVPHAVSVESYIKGLSEKRQEETKVLINMMSAITGEKPVMWGTSMVGFGKTHLVYESGREIDYFLIGFAARQRALTIYLSIEVNKRVFDQLGKHTKGVGCLYINQLSDVDFDELKNICEESVQTLKKHS